MLLLRGCFSPHSRRSNITNEAKMNIVAELSVILPTVTVGLLIWVKSC